MAQILVRDVETSIVERLKVRAKRHGRSLQGEVKVILIEATDLSLREAHEVSGRWQKRLGGGGQVFGDSAASIREDRNR